MGEVLIEKSLAQIPTETFQRVGKQKWLPKNCRKGRKNYRKLEWISCLENSYTIYVKK